MRHEYLPAVISGCISMLCIYKIMPRSCEENSETNVSVVFAFKLLDWELTVVIFVNTEAYT